MTDEIKKLLSKSRIIVDTCSLMINEQYFFGKELFEFLKESHLKISIPDAVDYELNHNVKMNKSKNDAQEGIAILNLYRQNNLLEVIQKPRSHADLQIIKMILDFCLDSDVVVFTEDKDLVVDILANIRNLRSSNLRHEVYCLKINQGNPEKWDLQKLEGKLNLMQNSNYSLIVKNDLHKMVISVVVDNSASMKLVKMDILKEAIANFQKNLDDSGLSEYVDYSLIIFEGLKSKVFKKFDEKQLNLDKLFAGGVPIINKSIELALTEMDKHANQIISSNRKIYKPWLVLLIDGENFGNLNLTLGMINDRINQGALSYFPFLLSENNIDDSLTPLIKYKRPFSIIHNKYDELFMWIFETGKRRIATPIDESFNLDPKSFDGWVKK